MSTMTAPIKVSPETDRIIADASHFLGRTKKDLVDAAVREYVDNHRDEINQSILDSLKLLDGGHRSSVRLLTGMEDAELDDLGGFAGGN